MVSSSSSSGASAFLLHEAQLKQQRPHRRLMTGIVGISSHDTSETPEQSSSSALIGIDEQQPPPPPPPQIPTSRICGVCLQSKERALFPRKEYLLMDNDNDQFRRYPTCTHCRKTLQANRIRVPPPKPILRGRKAQSGITRKPNNFGYCNYIDKLFGMDCFPDIVKCGAFTTAKDVSESMAALQAATFHGTDTDSIRSNVVCLSIGDGSTPRSAVLVAFLKKGLWRSISIDPALKPEWRGNHPTIRGLFGFCGTLEEFVTNTTTDAAVHNKLETPDNYPSQPPKPDHIILLCVHSHARFVGSASVSSIRALYGGDAVPMTIVSLPCCAKFRHVGDIGRPPNVQYDDDCVFSACRTVEVWNFPAEEMDGGSVI